MESDLEPLPGGLADDISRLRDQLRRLRSLAGHSALPGVGTGGWAHGSSFDAALALVDQIGEQAARHSRTLPAGATTGADDQDSRLVVDNIPGLVALLAATGEVQFVNRQILEYTGRSLEQLKHWGTSDIVHPDDLPHVIQVFTESIRSGRPYSIVQRLRRADGAYRWFQNKGSPLRDASEKVVRWCVLLTDVDEQHRAEETLRERERESRVIIDSVPALAWSTGPDGGAEFFNKLYQDFTGLREDEAVGWGWMTTIHPDDLQALVKTWQRILAAGTPGEAEARLRCHDGSYRWFLIRANPFRDATGAIVKWYGTHTDIEDRKQTEHDLRRSEVFLAQAQRLTLTGSLWWKPSTGDIVWSAESYRVMGYPSDTRPTLDLILQRIHPDDLPRVTEAIGMSAREGTNIDLEHRLLMPDGSIKHVHVVVQNVDDDEFVGAVSDITERKNAEAELRRAYDSFADAQRLSHTGNFTADIVADEHLWSDELYRIFEFDPRTRITVQLVRGVIHPEDLPSFDAGFARSLGGADFDLVFRIVTPTGKVKHVRSLAHLVERVAGRPLFIGAIQDVTENRMAEEALSRARSELAHVARVTTLSTLTASIAHEVNQPLSGIMTNAGTCLRMLDDGALNIDGARETARRIIRDGNRASEVIARLRALFSKREFTLEALDINEAIREVIALSMSELQRSHIVLETMLTDGLPAVTGDRIQLQQVVLNLLRNALEAMLDVHTRPRRLVVRTGQETGDRVSVMVRDSGVGITAERLNTLFEPFQTTKPEGMGIGLSISRSIIERHSGSLWVESNDGPGTTFCFSLPCEEAPPTPHDTAHSGSDTKV